ncbi:MAG: EscU/YscU/HrcU family type III secretion system export apparatus switch protein [Treponemataceae bacterium]|nr:EscU/YscU/HrcU family type III secretion system export apparatus switch protein [Treponemataceae bacterium]
MTKMDKKACLLKYPEGSPAPFLIAKGKNKLAERIIELADQNNVPLVKNECALEAISMLEIGECIPEESYEIFAKIFAFIKEIEK